MAYAHNAHATRPSLADRLSAVYTDAVDAWGRYKLYRNTLNELSSLSDRDLYDLGLHRSEIGRVALDAAYNAAK